MGRESRRNRSAEKARANDYQKPLVLTGRSVRDTARLGEPVGAFIKRLLGIGQKPRNKAA